MAAWLWTVWRGTGPLTWLLFPAVIGVQLWVADRLRRWQPTPLGPLTWFLATLALPAASALGWLATALMTKLRWRDLVYRVGTGGRVEAVEAERPAGGANRAK